MLIEVTVAHVPNIGDRGTRKEMPDALANVLILLKRARKVDEPGARATRRIYQRRDMTAEQAPAPEPVVIEKKPARKPRGRRAAAEHPQ